MTTSELTPPQAPMDAAERAARDASGRRRLMGAGKQMHAGPVTYVVLAVFALVSLAPLLWTVVAASRTNQRLAETPPPLWIGGNLFKNLQSAWEEGGLGTAMVNSTIVAGTITVGTVLFSTLAGFAFAKLRFKFSNV
ncbi:carbohydrate ABC transporter permease, partial [Streptomyces anthocyanicus]